MRRGLFFWALNLHRADCPTCKRETLYRHDFPLTCRWCGASMIDLGRWHRDDFNLTRRGSSV